MNTIDDLRLVPSAEIFATRSRLRTQVKAFYFADVMHLAKYQPLRPDVGEDWRLGLPMRDEQVAVPLRVSFVGRGRARPARHARFAGRPSGAVLVMARGRRAGAQQEAQRGGVVGVGVAHREVRPQRRA